MLYRVRQLIDALWPKVCESEYAWLFQELSAEEAALFSRQTLTEQRHALDVAFDIQKQKITIEIDYGTDGYHNLLHAALLHDCGKSLIALRLWQRVFIVLFDYLPANTQKRIVGQRSLLGKTLTIYRQHPVWGKRLAARTGLSPDIQGLILKHHAPISPLDELLYLSDSRH